MGSLYTRPISGAETTGYHVLKVHDNSPAINSFLEAYFDFIVAIEGHCLTQENDLLIDKLSANIGKVVELGIYNIKSRSYRNLSIVPSDSWGGKGLLGASIRFCSFESVTDNIWHVLEVYPNSPAMYAGLHSYTDYIIGYELMEEDLSDFIKSNYLNDAKLFVYNIMTRNCREVIITPDNYWGGNGYLGCSIGKGYLHRIPINFESQPTRTYTEIDPDYKFCNIEIGKINSATDMQSKSECKRTIYSQVSQTNLNHLPLTSHVKDDISQLLIPKKNNVIRINNSVQDINLHNAIHPIQRTISDNAIDDKSMNNDIDNDSENKIPNSISPYFSSPSLPSIKDTEHLFKMSNINFPLSALSLSPPGEFSH